MSPVAPTMSASEIPRQSSVAITEQRLSYLEIDASCRRVLLLLFNSGLVWVTIALLLLLISFVKLHAPGFLADASWLTLGRVRPAGMNAFLYGFGSQMAMGTMVWMFCRLGGNRLF